MAFISADRVKETTTTTGTGAITLDGAAAGFRSFASVMSAADTCHYCIVGNNEWEVGLGTYNTTLARTTVLASSNGGSAVDFSAGTKDIFITLNRNTILTLAAAASHTHAISDVTGLQAALDAKVDDSQVSAFGATLIDDADAATARTTLGLGSASTLSTSDIDERARDAVGTALVAGSNITITPNDGADTITIAASGGVSSGTSFPGSPASGDRFYRTDLKFEFYYDGTRWLSSQQFQLQFGHPTALVSTGVVGRLPNPRFSRSDIYLEGVTWVLNIAGTGNWTATIYSYDGSTPTSVIAETSNATARLGLYETIGTVITSGVDAFEMELTENSGTATTVINAIVDYRIIAT